MIILQGLKLKNQRGDITGLKKEANVQSPRLRSPFPGAGRRKGIIISSVSPVAVAMFTRVVFMVLSLANGESFLQI